MRHAECIITGAEFFDVAQHRWCHCDLYRMGQVLIANAVVRDEKTGNVVWHYNSAPPVSLKVVSCTDGSYFEKRGVIVFAVDASDMNDVATRYLKGDIGRRM